MYANYGATKNMENLEGFKQIQISAMANGDNDKPHRHYKKRLKIKSPLADYEKHSVSKGNDAITISELSDLYESYLTGGKTVRRSEDNFHEYSSYVSHKGTINIINRVFFDLWDTPVSEINNTNFRLWATDHFANTGVKASTMNRCITALRGMFSWAARYNYITGPKLRGLELFSEPSLKNRGVRRCLSSQEINRLIKTLERREIEKRDSRDSNNARLKARHMPEIPEYPDYGQGYVDYVYPMVMTALLTGGRKGSLRGLKWRDVDFEGSTIIYQGENSKAGNTIIVPMTKKLREILMRWKKQKNITESFEDKNKFVFSRDGVLPLSITSPSCWHDILKDAKIENFRWHDMRHTYASTLIQNGVDIATVKELMGHSDIKTTAIYLHVAPKHMKESVKVFDHILNAG